MSLNFITANWEFFVFILLLSLFLIYKKKNLVLQGSFPIFYILMYRTKLGLDKMRKWSDKHPRTFLYLAYLSIFVGVLGMFFILILMFWQLFYIVSNDIGAGGGFVLPIKTEKGLESAVPVFYVPFLYWILAILVLAIVHEFAHGVIAERFKIRIKSSGFAFFGILAPILPAAFVEPDEKSLESKPKWQQIAVLGAGSTSNFIFGFLFLLMWIFLAVPFVENTTQIESIKFSSVMNGSSLEYYNISSGEILEFNGISDKNEIMLNFRNLSVNQSIELKINSSGFVETYNVVTFENPMSSDRGMIGISGISTQTSNKLGWEWIGPIPVIIAQLLFWLWLLNIGIGLMNLLPIWITDGGKILLTMLQYKFSLQTSLSIYNFISLLSIVLIIFTLWPALLSGFF